MKIILTRPNYKSHIITPPLGLGYLASYLKKEGIEVKIIDGLRENLTPTALVQRIVDEKPEMAGINCLTAFYHEAVQLAIALREKDIRVVIGGAHPTILPYQTLVDCGADYVICGEGEIPLLKLITNNFMNDNIPGVYSRGNLFCEGNGIQKAEVVENLDEISFPDWEQLDPRRYPKAPHGAIVKNFPIGVLTTTRGCPYACTFCATPKLYDRRLRFRSPENVIQEIKYLVDSFGVKEIHFEDDNLTLNRKHVENICNLLIENNLKISWACPNGIRADKVDESLIKLMKKSGCYYFAYGIESANQQILENIKKMETIEQIAISIEIAHKVGISCQGFFIFGLPGETRETIEKTINFAKRSKLSRAQFLILDVLPGSELWDTLKGKFTPNWKKDSYKEPEWLPESLSKKEIMEAQVKAFRQFYFRPIVFFRLARGIRLRQIKFLFERLRDYRILGSSIL
jgi:magnesium-protoporphyrin IX monomethyl ester (oxidative) cyclase